MKKLILFAAATLLMLCTACSGGDCHISGTMPNDNYEGVLMYLVPVQNPDSIGVDSAIIKNRKFEFSTNKSCISVLRIDYSYRYGLQELFVVCEPGDVTVYIDSISTCFGTPQNDSLQIWKDLTDQHRIEMAEMRKEINSHIEAGDTAAAMNYKTQADQLHKNYKDRTRQMAENLGEGTLFNFLNDMYPRTYQRVSPDGYIHVVDADTNQEIR